MLLLLSPQVYRLSNNGPECTTHDWSAVPGNATMVWKKCRFAGQPLVIPHADPQECWPELDTLLAQLVWRLMGSPPGQLDKISSDLRR